EMLSQKTSDWSQCDCNRNGNLNVVQVPALIPYLPAKHDSIHRLSNSAL
uniref:Uncharacterized protein n=1 Tax=Haemonchus contortus TaxID=6289 RepID=A0A7I4YFZ4_HAECO